MIFRSIIKYTDEINTIYINVYNYDDNYNGDYDEGDDFYIRLFGLNDAKKCLSKLKKFKIKGFINKFGIINQIMNCNPKLKIVYIQKYDFTLKNHQLMKFLLNQNHLTKITISGLNYEGSYDFHDMEGSITNSLESLKIMKCNVSDDLLRFFINCNNYINYNNYNNNDIIHDIKFLNDQNLRDFTNNLNEDLKLLNFGMWKISIEGLKIILSHKRLCLKNLSCILYNGNPYHIERLIMKYKEFNHRNRIISNYTITKLYVDCYYYGKKGKKSSSKDHNVYIEWVLK
ncbi:hypothetical protein RIR_jg12155.t1 [Rhizophagus irregularis DAOM 181602=DAOM 197198]|nr:hypothetical protein RIR_jg12155.t1 [Rhizophagus irregularis DAOM 181602=DAOM 197198]